MKISHDELDVLAHELWDQRSAAGIQAMKDYNFNNFLPLSWDQATKRQKDRMRKLAYNLYKKGLPNIWEHQHNVRDKI
jgi:hypothetical protein